MARFNNLSVNRLNVTKVMTGDSDSASEGYPLYYLKGSNTNISANASTATQTVAALTIPANTKVLQVYTQVVTSANATCSATIGDGTTVAGWDASVDFVAAANTRYAGIVGTDAYAVGKLYSSSDTIDAVITFSTTTTTGVFRVDALCVRE